MAVAQALTYTSLTNDLQAYLERQDSSYTQQIPRIIAQAENEIITALRTLEQLVVDQTTLKPNQTVIPKPVRWKKTVSMRNVPSGAPILNRTTEYLTNYNGQSTPSDVVKYYADYDYNNWLVNPVSLNTGADIEIIYYARPQPLSDQTQENLITRELPHILLACCLKWAYAFNKNTNKSSEWDQRYQAYLNEAKQQDMGRITDRNTIRPQPDAQGQ